MLLNQEHAQANRNVLNSTPASLRRNGFTLVELLVVTALIALLIAMLLPALSKARIGSQLTVCQSRQRLIGNGLTSYAIAERGTYPTYRNDSGHFADAYDLRRAHPYSGATDRPALGLGLVASTGNLSVVGQTIHCPSFDNSQGVVWNGSGGFAPNHCMDVQHPWGYGGSGWSQNPGHRIIGSYTYRGTSYQIVNGRPPRTKVAASDFVTLIDVADQRFRGEQSANNAHGGYNLTFGDGSVFFFEDQGYEVDFMVKAAGGTMNGRHRASNDEAVYNFMGDQR